VPDIGGFWVNRTGSRFTVELTPERRSGPVPLRLLSGYSEGGSDHTQRSAGGRSNPAPLTFGDACYPTRRWPAGET